VLFVTFPLIMSDEENDIGWSDGEEGPESEGEGEEEVAAGGRGLRPYQEEPLPRPRSTSAKTPDRLSVAAAVRAREDRVGNKDW
jgi:hypothetical protein